LGPTGDDAQCGAKDGNGFITRIRSNGQLDSRWDGHPELGARRIGAGDRRTRQGRFDGIEVERDGMVLITSWADSSVESVEGDKLVRRIGGFGSPADVTYDAVRHRVGVVLLQQNQFELRTLP
jgi:hypothetical protein